MGEGGREGGREMWERGRGEEWREGEESRRRGRGKRKEGRERDKMDKTALEIPLGAMYVYTYQKLVYN